VTLSAYLVKAIYSKGVHSMNFMEIVEQARLHTRIWWVENREVAEHAERNFEMFTGFSFLEHRDEVLNGYADHYAEKAFASAHLTDEFVLLLEGIRFKEEDKKLLQDLLQSKTLLCMTSHFGGVDFLPACLSQNGLPTSVFLRFKSPIARETAFKQMENLQQWFDLKLLDADASLAREMYKMAKKPRILVTVADSFKNWRRGEKERHEIHFLGHRFGLDNTPTKLAALMEAPVFFMILHRIKPGDYEITLESVEPDENGYSYPVFCKWQELVLGNPAQWYAWEELHWTWTLDPCSPDSEVSPEATL